MIWFSRGWGFLVIVVGFGCLLMTQLFVNTITQDDKYYQTHGWPVMLTVTV